MSKKQSIKNPLLNNEKMTLSDPFSSGKSKNEKKVNEKPLGKMEWESIKKLHKGKCAMCGKMESEVGCLEKAHLKAQSKGGQHIFPLCPTDHVKFDKGLCSDEELKAIGVESSKYIYYRPKAKKAKKK